MSRLGDKHWTRKQIELLKKGYINDIPFEQLTHSIGKTSEAIRMKAQRLGIKRPVEQLPEGYKRCPHCNEIKNINTGFYKGQSWCKSCTMQKRQIWGRKNKEHLRLYHHIRTARDPKKTQATAARSSHKQRALFKNGHNLTAIEWEEILIAHANICPLCKRPFSKTDPPERDCIIAVSKGGRLTVGNVQPVHATCNNKKGTK
jgi:hypothetical protein